MSWATEYIKQLHETPYYVWFRPQGRSMEPLVLSGQNCCVERTPHSIRGSSLVGRIALAAVNGKNYLHLIGACAFNGEWFYRIENASGHVNGWVKIGHIHGLLKLVED